MNTERASRTLGSFRKDTLILLSLALFTFLLHILTSAFTEYGYFIDEFYYIACTKRLAFGYVDQPPLSIFLLAVNRWVLGDSLPALRFLPAIASGATVFLAGLMARRFSGGLAAQGIAALCVTIAPAYLIFGGFYSMNPFELLIWTAIGLVVIKLIQEENSRLWLWVGLLLGLGFEMKHTMVLYVLSLGLGILFTPARRFLWNRWIVLGGFVALVLLLPNIIWQILNGYPSLEFYRNALVNKNIPTGPLGVLSGQILIVNPITFPLWLLGLLFFFVNTEGKTYRAFGWCSLILLLFMIGSQSSRPDRITALYPILFAAGAVMVERYASRIHRRWPVVATAGIIAAGGIVYAPVCVPILPPATLVRYMSLIGFQMNIERGKSSELPQWFADRFGWKELVAEVGRVFHDLPPELQRNCVIIAGSYGQAGAIELYGEKYGLPPAYSTHNSYHVWGPPPDSVKTYIGVLVSKRDLEGFFESVAVAGLSSCRYCMNYEREVPIYLARGPKGSIKEAWPRIKHFE